MPRTPLFRLALGFCSCLAATAVLAQGSPVGPEFQVNTYDFGRQDRPDVAVHDDGDFVVVWRSEFQDGSYGGVFAQRFDADGNELGGEFQVNTYFVNSQRGARVASTPSGGFIVVWSSVNQNEGGSAPSDIYAQRFNAAGTALGAELQVSEAGIERDVEPDVATDSAGNFVVTWARTQYYNEGYGGAEIYGRRFDAFGVPQGSEFQINSYTTGSQYSARVAMNPNGSFVVVWSGGDDGDQSGVAGQLFDNTGAPDGAEFQINAYTSSDQARPEVGVAANGDFVVAWQGHYGQDGSGTSVQARRFDASATPLGDEFQVNAYTTQSQDDIDLAVSEDGSFVATWRSRQLKDDDVIARRFNADDGPRGDEFVVNAYTTDSQRQPAVAELDENRFVVVWHSDNTGLPPLLEELLGGGQTDIFGQRFSYLIFEDDFESGDTSAWSNVVP